MHHIFKCATVAFVVLAFLTVPFSAMAEEGFDEMKDVSDAAMAADTVLVRPLGIVSLVTGFGIFIVSSPFSALGGNIGEAWDTLVTTPAKFTFKRPLGDF